VLRRIIAADDDGDDSYSDGSGDGQEAAAGVAGSGANTDAGAGEPVVLPGFLLAALFRARPELAELVHLELKSQGPSHDLEL